MIPHSRDPARGLQGIDSTSEKGRGTTLTDFAEAGPRLIEHSREFGLAAIEMECAALYALAEARGYPIVCLAHVTSTMAVSEGDFEKDGRDNALRLIDALAKLGVVDFGGA